MQSCALEHLSHPSACCLGRIQSGSHMARACFSRVGVGGAGWGISWNRGLVLVGAVCGGEDSKWYTSGPVHGFEWRRKHNVADRRTKKANNQDPGLVAVATATSGPVHAGKGAGSKRPGKKARERLRRREAKKRDQSSMGRPDRAQARGPRDQVEQTDRQQQAPANIAADDDLAAPSSREPSAGGGENGQQEFCARSNRNQSGAPGSKRGFIRR